MTLQSVLQIDVDDARFKRFHDLFQKYQAALAKTPEMWARATKEQRAMAANFERLAASVMATSHMHRESLESLTDQNSELTRSERLWSSISRSSRSTLDSIVSAGSGLLRWSGILGAVGGLFAGVWGIDKIAGGTARDRRSSLGLGMSIGQYRAFGMDFGRFVDTESFLGNLNAMETDITKQAPAYALLGHGLTGQTSADAVAMLTAARGLAQRTPTNQLSTMFGAFGLSFSPEELRRLQGSKGEFNELLGKYQGDQSTLNIQDRVAKAWTDLVRRLEIDGSKISQVFTEKLVSLSKPIGDLADGFTKAVTAFMHTDVIGNAITSLGGWLETLDTKLASFTTDVGDVADEVHRVLHPWETLKEGAGALGDRMRDLGLGGTGNAPSGGLKRFMAFQDFKYGLPKGLVETVAALERSGPNDFSAKGALGIMQLMPKTAEQYGVTDAFNIEQNVGAGAHYLADLYKQYKGDVAKALAAYNFGPGNVDKLVSQYGQDWRAHLPKETSQYLANANPLLSGFGSQVRVDVYNHTGSDVVVTSSGLAGPGPALP